MHCRLGTLEGLDINTRSIVEGEGMVEEESQEEKKRGNTKVNNREADRHWPVGSHGEVPLLPLLGAG